ncbi:MAG: cellulose biosynthesis cyclic di-GMP-binding regulatory protein BcsB [Pseudolabrys sp.]|nr:cellulose biosynthesis cyclic di-GMP-binding regulatory protein BcsB [Pseudolabrys sp.]
MLAATVTLADVGFKNGIRFANLGGRREIFIPLPQGADLNVTQLSLVLDDLSAHEARRNVEVLVNDRSVAAIALDGKGNGRTVRIPLQAPKPIDGYIKISFVYAGAATQDRCIDVRYVGDSLTVRPDSGIELEFDPTTLRDVSTIAALMPRDVTILLPNHQLSTAEFASALTVARSLAATGRRAKFRSGYSVPPDVVDANGRRRWMNGFVIIGTPDDVTGAIPTVFKGDGNLVGEINAVRIEGYPALLVSDGAGGRAARLLGNRSLGAVRGLSSASVVTVSSPKLDADRITFDELGLALGSAEVYGRADIGLAIDTRSLPANSVLSRLMLDIMVAPDGAGEKAVVSVFINDRLMASAVAAQGDPTRIDIPLPEGLVGTIVNMRAMVQRRSPQGDCRFEPQGYPAQILGSSTLILAKSGPIHDFSDLATRWTNGILVVVPAMAASRPDRFLGLLADIVGGLSPELAPVKVRYSNDTAPSDLDAPFVVVSALPPSGTSPYVRFDRGRVAVSDRSGNTLLDLGGFSTGAVAQLANANGHPGIWVPPFAAGGTLPSPAVLRLDRGNVAFIDSDGVALAMSTERDTLIRVAYPDQVSWIMVAKRFQSWIIGALWLFATIAFLFALQRIRRRRPRTADE